MSPDACSTQHDRLQTACWHTERTNHCLTCCRPHAVLHTACCVAHRGRVASRAHLEGQLQQVALEGAAGRVGLGVGDPQHVDGLVLVLHSQLTSHKQSFHDSSLDQVGREGLGGWGRCCWWFTIRARHHAAAGIPCSPALRVLQALTSHAAQQYRASLLPTSGHQDEQLTSALATAWISAAMSHRRWKALRCCTDTCDWPRGMATRSLTTCAAACEALLAAALSCGSGKSVARSGRVRIAQRNGHEVSHHLCSSCVRPCLSCTEDPCLAARASKH